MGSFNQILIKDKNFEILPKKIYFKFSHYIICLIILGGLLYGLNKLYPNYYINRRIINKDNFNLFTNWFRCDLTITRIVQEGSKYYLVKNKEADDDKVFYRNNN